MALVCDIKSDTADQQQPPTQPSNEDLEDGEIEDDEEETPVDIAAPAAEPAQPLAAPQAPPPQQPQQQQHTPLPPPPPIINRFGPQQHDKYRDRRKHDDKKKPHLTEAEKHVMHLHKLERLEREKREKYRREQVVDDFASNIEKAIANVLKKERPSMNEDDKEDDKRQSRKRKKKDKERRKNEKQRRLDSPKAGSLEENEPLRAASPEKSIEQQQQQQQQHSPHSLHENEESNESEYSSDNGRDKKHYQRGRKSKNRDRHERKYNNRETSRDMRVDTQMKDSPSVCLFYLQGKCNKGDDCPYSHEVMLPMKLELCKFYQMECCAKGDKCLYMHSEFPCKFYHTGLPCPAGDNCKFAHGRPLSDSLKQILFKHIETAPREILGGFPRLNRDEVFAMINETQKVLEEKKAGDDGKDDGGEKKRNRPSRWQEADGTERQFAFALKGFYAEQDQDLRVSAINSNGDVDMRTLQLHPTILAQAVVDNSETKQDVDIRHTNFMMGFNVEAKQDVDSRQLTALASKDVDCRRLPYAIDEGKSESEDNNLQMDVDERKEEESVVNVPVHLPKKQRELFLRIQAQQKDTTLANQPNSPTTDDNNIDWYSDDDDDDDENRLTIKDDVEDVKEKEENEEDKPEPSTIPYAPGLSPIKPVEVIEKLGDLSKIDISDAVTKLLSSISQSTTLPTTQNTPSTSSATPRDPRQGAQQQSAVEEAAKPVINDPRRARILSLGSPTSSQKTENLSIYEQGGLSVAEVNKDVDLRMTEKDLDLRSGNFGDTDLRSSRPDIDLRQLSIPFKGIQNYTPASEIDASINSHPLVPWKVQVVDVPRPDYSGLKLSLHDAQTTGDPRLRKIFRLSTEEKDSPASPKESPKARVDPRRRKMEEAKSDIAGMSYTQQLSVLQNSAFYQSLTSNQKLLLNKELSDRADQSGNNDAVLNSILTNLGLVSNVSQSIGAANVSALNILANVNNLGNVLNQTAGILPQGAPMGQMGQNQVNPNILAHNPNLMNQMAQGIVQPGLLGAAPGIPNLPPINFDPRNGGGLLGNAPGFGGGFNDNTNFGFNNDEFYQDNSFRNERNFNRDGRGRRGGRNNFNRNMRKFRNMSRNQRGHTPP